MELKKDDRIGYDLWFHLTYTTVGDVKTVAEYTLRTYLEQNLVRSILQRFVGKIRRALDYGCGYGRLTCVLGEFAEEEVVGIDMRENVIQLAKAVYKPWPKYKFLSFTDLPDYLGKSTEVVKLPFEDGYFNLTMTFTVLQHIQNVEDWLKELKRVTSKWFLAVEEVKGKVSKHEFPRPVEEYEELMKPFKLIHYEPRRLYNTSCRGDTAMAMLFRRD